MATKLVLVLSVGVGITFAADKGPMDSLADKADAVVVAEVLLDQQVGSLLTYALSIVRSLKGNSVPGSTINISETITGQSPARANLQGDYGLWFLKRNGAQWSFIPAYPGVLHSPAFIELPKSTSPLAVQTRKPPSSVNDLIAAELAAAIQSYINPTQLFFLARALTGIQDSSITKDIHHDFHGRTDPELKFIGLLGLLSTDEQASALAEIAASPEVLSNLQVGPLIVLAISGVRGTDKTTVQSLGQLAQSSFFDVQRPAVEALQRIHTVDTLPFLAQSLASNDGQIRDAALWGFTKFIENRPVEVPTYLPGTLLGSQGPRPYRTPETDKHLMGRPPGLINVAEYVQFWLSWWTTMAPELAPGK